MNAPVYSGYKNGVNSMDVYQCVDCERREVELVTLLSGTSRVSDRYCHRSTVSVCSKDAVKFHRTHQGEFHSPFSLQASKLTMVTLIVLMLLNACIVSVQSIEFPDSLFAKKLLADFGNDTALTLVQLQTMIDSLKKQSTSETSHDGKNNEMVTDPEGTNSINLCNRSTTTWKSSKMCLETQCLSAEDLVDLYSVGVNTPYPKLRVKDTDLTKLSTALLYQAHNNRCVEAVRKTTEKRQRPDSASSWGYGFLFVTIINMCALLGALLMPFMKLTIYKQILLFMVGLAVGSLAGSGLLFLIPEAFNLVTDENHSDYIWKSTTVMAGIYLFFLIERFLKLIMAWKKKRDRQKTRMPKSQSSDSVATNEDYGICSVQFHTPSSVLENNKMRGMDGIDPNRHVQGICGGIDGPAISRQNSSETKLDKSSGEVNCNGNTVHVDQPLDSSLKQLTNSEKYESPEKTEIATVAWMIIFGDALHNFIDGLSIGAAFTENILAGVSVSVAVICEELPHELGDFAILLNAGMSVKRALLYNFLSACMCYLGLVFGILLGQNTLAHDWIFAIAGGMFLYISLVDMLPEMNSAAEEEEKKADTICHKRVFLLQNSGILIGYTLLLLMALYGHLIQFD